jgi:hypothetical protein
LNCLEFQKMSENLVCLLASLVQRKWPLPTIRHIVSSVHTCEEHISQPCANFPRNSSMMQKAMPANIDEVSCFWKTTNIMKTLSF